MFGNTENPEMFMRMVLGLDQQQVLTLLNGFVYHTFFLDAFAGQVPSLLVLHNIILAFGLIGFTLLALQRSLWTPSVIISWIVLVGLLILGSRGTDVLFSPLNRGNIDAAIKGSSFQDTVTTYDNAMDTVRWIENGREVDSSASPGVAFPTTGAMMSKSLESAQTLAQGQGSGSYKITDVGAFTPMVFVLYTFNTMKKQLLSGMSNRINVDILNRTGMANRIGAGQLYPSTQFLFRTFVDECGGGDLSGVMLGGGQINNAPESIGKVPLETGKTVEQTLTEREFTFRNLVNMQRNYFDDIKTTSYMKSFVGMPVGRATITVADAKNLITIPPAAIWGNLSWGAGKSEKVLESYLAGQRQGDDSYYQNMRDNITRSDLSLDAPGLKRKSVIYASIYKMSAGKPGTSTSSGSGIKKGSVTFSNCWELYKEYFANLGENFGGSEIERRLGKLAFESEAQGLKPNNGVLILNPTAKKESDSDVALAALEKKCSAACNYVGGENVKKCPACNFTTGICKPEFSSMSAMGAIGTAVGMSMQASTCLAAQKDYVWAQELVRGGAVDVELGKIAAADEYFRDPKKMSSGVRDFTADMGKYLGPIAMWFFALFGGFAAGAYSAIVPSFMNFTLMMIFALTPFMFMMGVLMPGWAPQIILTPIVAVAYLKIVEVMFILVGFVFAALRIGLENSGLITPPSWLMIFKGVDTFNAMYDIMIGMAYTSMFAIAGFMLVGVRSPEKLVGALASYGDKTGRIDASEVLKIGAATAAAYGAVKKVGGGVMKVYDGGQNIKFGVNQIKEKGLGKGLKDTATALTGNLSERGQKRQLALQGRLDGVDNTSSEYNQQRQQSELKRDKRLLGLELVDDATAEDAYALEGNKQKQAAASKARTEGALRGAGQGDQVDKERYNRNVAGGGSVRGDSLYEKGRATLVKAVTETYRSELTAQGLSKDEVSGKLATLKAAIQGEVDKLMVTSASRLNLKGEKFMDDKDGIDYEAGKVVGEFDFRTAEGQAFEARYGQQMRAAGFIDNPITGKQRLVYDLNKTTKGGKNPSGGNTSGAPGGNTGSGGSGGGNGGGNNGGSAFGGSTPNGGMRSPGGIILNGSVADALKARDETAAQRAAKAGASATAQKIASVVAEEVKKALGGLGDAVATGAGEAVDMGTKTGSSSSAQAIREKFSTNDRNMTETQREKLTDPSNISNVVKDIQERMKELQDDATTIKGDVSDIKDKPKK